MNELKGYEWITSCKICAGDRLVPLTNSPMANFYQCGRCLVIFLNPQPTVGTLEQRYNRTDLMESGPASAYSKHNKFYLREIYRERLRDVLRYKDHGDLLDVGCGMGDFCGVAREVGFNVFGTEFSDTYADQAKTTVGLREIYIGRLQEIEFAGKQFDLITLWHVLEHLPDPLETLVILRNLVKSGGVVAIEVPNAEEKRKRPKYLADFEDYPLDRLEHIFYYSGRALQNACTSAGFKILGLNFLDAHQPSKNTFHHIRRKIKRPLKQVAYLGNLNLGFSAVRIFLTT